MKYSLINLFPNDQNQIKVGVGYYNQQLIEYLIKYYKHECIPENKIEKDTIILISMFTLDSLPHLKKVRQKYPDHTIITGGQFAFNYPACLIYADYCVIGEGFEFFQCNSLEEIKALDCVTWKEKDKMIIPSSKIEWQIVPVCKIGNKGYMYWKGVGCRNKCGFCFPSWTRNRQENDERRIRAASAEIAKKHSYLTLISNEYDEDFTVKVKDMMVKQYVKIPMKFGNPLLIRMGVEFPTPELRKRYGKPFSDEDLYEAFDKAERERKELQIWFIPGLSPLEDITNLLCGYERLSVKPRIFVKLTNMVYTPYTPIHKEAKNIHWEWLATPEYRIHLRKELEDHGGSRFRFLKTAYPRKALYETAMWHVTSEEDINIANRIYKTKDPKESVDILKSSGLLENDCSERVIMWYQKNKRTKAQTYQEHQDTADQFISKYQKVGEGEI